MRALPTGTAATRLDGYELVLELATGDTTVLLARRTGPRSFSRWVTIRYVGPFVEERAPLLDRIDADLARASVVRHPYVLPIHEHGSLANGRFVVTDYIEGATVAELTLASPSRVPVEIACGIVLDALSGLEAIQRTEDHRGQSLSLAHGAIAPSSMVVGIDGKTRLANLGLAAGASIHHRAPEVVRGEPATPASDVFSTGLVLYELLGGHAGGTDRAPDEPFPLLSIVAPSIDPGVAEVVARAVSIDPSMRFQSADAFARALERTVVPASARDVGGFVAARCRDALEHKRQLQSEWVRAHVTALGEPTISTVARLRRATRRLLRRRKREARLLFVAALIAAGALAGVIAWRFSL